MGGDAGPGLPGWGVCVRVTLLKLCLCASFLAVCTAATRCSKASALTQEGVALPGTRRQHWEHREQQAAWPPPLPTTSLQGQLRSPHRSSSLGVEYELTTGEGAQKERKQADNGVEKGELEV